MRIGESIILGYKSFLIQSCQHCSKAMVNIDSDELRPGDLAKLKLANVVISNPETDELVCIHCDIEKRPSRRKSLSDWFKSDSSNDAGWFTAGAVSSGFNFGSFGGGMSHGGGFGGFGGGSFGGGGASGGF